MVQYSNAVKKGVLNDSPVTITVSMFALTCVCFPICISKRTARQPRGGGRGPLMTPQQEERICAMVAANNALRLREIQRTVVNDDTIFGNIQSISISTIDRVLRRNEMSMKQLYRVPFERNSDRVKELRHQYVQVTHVRICTSVHCNSLGHVLNLHLCMLLQSYVQFQLYNLFCQMHHYRPV